MSKPPHKHTNTHTHKQRETNATKSTAPGLRTFIKNSIIVGDPLVKRDAIGFLVGAKAMRTETHPLPQVAN